jgi:hypothetical protein
MRDRLIALAFLLTPALAVLGWRLRRDRDKGLWAISPLALWLILALLFVLGALATATRNASGWWLGLEAPLLALFFARRSDPRGESTQTLPWRFSLSRMMLLVAMLAVLAGVFADWIDRDPTEYGRLIRSTDASFRILYQRLPNNIDPAAWVTCCSLIQRGYFDAGFDNTSPSLREMADFDNDLKKKLKGPVGPDTLQWTWNRLQRIGRLKEPLKASEETFRRNLEQCLAPRPMIGGEPVVAP